MASSRRKIIRRFLYTLPPLLLAAWVVPSFFSAEPYRRRLEAGLQQSLGRPVTFRTASFRLLWRPGFTLRQAAVREDPSFGSEPFARADNIDCALRWRSLLLSHIDCAHLSLEGVTFNVVRNADGEWNVERFVRRSRMGPRSSRFALRPAGGLEIDAEDGRINFKVGQDKKPFSITEFSGRAYFDTARGLIRYDLSGRPTRSDLSLPMLGVLPSPGTIELAGEWVPGDKLQGLSAKLQTRKSLLYDWIPLLTGRNPEIYGVLDLNALITGSFEEMRVEGDCEISQLHRWELPPPSDSVPVRVDFRGLFNRGSGNLHLETVTGTFGRARLGLTGSVTHLADVAATPQLDLLLAVEDSHLEDVLAVGRRFWAETSGLEVSGRLGGAVAIQGSWSNRQYQGLLTTRDVRVRTPQGIFPVSSGTLRIDARGAQLSPVRIALTPHVDAVMEGGIYLPGPVLSRPRSRQQVRLRRTRRGRPAGVTLADSDRGRSPGPYYSFSIAVQEVPLRDLVHVISGRSRRVLQEVEVRQGVCNGSLRFTGRAWPPERPVIGGRFEIQAAKLLVPGLNEPLLIPRAQLAVNGSSVLASPVVAQISNTSFTGWVARDPRRPWAFNLRASGLSVEQASQWFEALARPASLLDRIPGLTSFSTRRAAALNLFRGLNAQGVLVTPLLTYRNVRLANFRTRISIFGRVVHLTGATFEAAGGHGRGGLDLDMSTSPARTRGDVSLDRANVHLIAAKLASAAQQVRGLVSGSASFETAGLSHVEMISNLQAQAAVKLLNVTSGEFDPLDALVRQARYGRLEPSRKSNMIHDASWSFEVHNQRVFLLRGPLEITGARLQLTGSYGFDGTLDLAVHCDFRHMARRWQKSVATGFATGAVSASTEAPFTVERNVVSRTDLQSPPASADVHLSGPLDKLTVAPALEISRSSP